MCKPFEVKKNLFMLFINIKAMAEGFALGRYYFT